jgi:3-deoxy-D-manno-octulosonate 8-phosphate phosphatase (KDO 8-P phosphatase)
MTLAERCRAVRLLCLDVDGVLTPGDVTHAPTGESKSFHVRDGTALKRWHQAGHHSAILSGRRSPMIAVRAAEIGMSTVIEGCHDKREAVIQLAHQLELSAHQVCFVGDDLIDVEALRWCGLAVAVADGCVESRAVAHYITVSPGGQAAVRETIERILRCQGHW